MRQDSTGPLCPASVSVTAAKGEFHRMARLASWGRQRGMSCLTGLVAVALAATWHSSALAAPGATTVNGAVSVHCYGCPVRAGDQLWLVRTHCALSPHSLEGVQVSRLAGEGPEWEDPAQALAADASHYHTIFFVHGYNYQTHEAVEAGCEVYRQLVACPMDRPLRMVIWAWPSAQQGKMLPDFRMKSCRADSEGSRLAIVLGQFSDRHAVTLVGHSLGARVITGALHELAGTEPQWEAAGGARPTVLLSGAAMDQSWLLPGGPHRRAVWQAERMTVLVNPHDPVLKRYHWVRRGPGPQALGYAGVACPQQLGAGYRQVDVSAALGHRHRLGFFLERSVIQTYLRALIAQTGPGPETLETASAEPCPDRSPI